MVHRRLFLRYGLNGGYEMATFLQEKATFSHRRRCGARRPTRSSSTGTRFRKVVTSPRLSNLSCSLRNCARASLRCVDCGKLCQQYEEGGKIDGKREYSMQSFTKIGL